MDPNANLAEQEAIYTDNAGIALTAWPADAISRLFELRQALGDWIRNGGFEPDWSKAPQASPYFRKVTPCP